MNRYLVTLLFPAIDEEFMSLIPAHRYFINELIEKDIVLSYAVNSKRTKAYIFIGGESEEKIIEHLQKSPLIKHVKLEVEELFVYDSSGIRFPKLVMN